MAQTFFSEIFLQSQRTMAYTRNCMTRLVTTTVVTEALAVLAKLWMA